MLLSRFTGVLVCAMMVWVLAGCGGRGTRADETVLWRTVGEEKLYADVYLPPNDAAGSSERQLRPAMVLLHGGAWVTGGRRQMRPLGRLVADEGWVAFAVDYRTRRNAGTRIPDAMADARAAMRWVRASADRFGVNPDRVAVLGGSAGGHLALSTVLAPEFDDPAFLPDIRSEPDALILLSPPVETRWDEGWPAHLRNWATRWRYDYTFRGDEEIVSLTPRLGAAPLPPTLIFHGNRDITVPLRQSLQLLDRARDLGQPVDVVILEGEGHGYLRHKNSPLIKECVRDGLAWLEAGGFQSGMAPLPP